MVLVKYHLRTTMVLVKSHLKTTVVLVKYHLKTTMIPVKYHLRTSYFRTSYIIKLLGRKGLRLKMCTCEDNVYSYFCISAVTATQKELFIPEHLCNSTVTSQFNHCGLTQLDLKGNMLVLMATWRNKTSINKYHEPTSVAGDQISLEAVF